MIWALSPWTRISGIAKLCDMMLPGYFAMAAVSATLIAFPELVEATTRTMFAPGAMAWAYCTSRLVSMLQPTSPWCELRGAKVGHPSGQKIVKDGGAGMWKTASNVARSCRTVGLPNASTIRMVCPLPSRVDGQLYALRTKLGAYRASFDAR